MPERGDRAPAHRPYALLGGGVLASEVGRRLAGLRTGGAGAAGRPVVAVGDGWDDDLLTRAADSAAAGGVAFLGVHVELGRALIGPAVLPGVPGCLRCLAARRSAVDFDGAGERAELYAVHRYRLAEPSTWLTAFAVHAVGGIVAAEVEALVHGRDPRTRGASIVVELDRLRTEVHPFLPDPGCRRCQAPARDAAVVLRSRPKTAPADLRTTGLGGREDELRRTFVDGFCGVVSSVVDRDACGMPVSYARTGLPGFDRAESGIGRAPRRTGSRPAAVLEALERRAGSAPAGGQPVVRARFADVADQAVDPRTLGLPPVQDPGPSGFACAPFDPDRETEWVWGHSFGRSQPVLVPRSYAYFGPAPAGSDELPLAYETSNGCALGGCFEEAVLHGLLEVAERDAFLLTWYARMPAPRVAIGSARSTETRLLADRLERTHGYRVLAFDTSVENGIPSVTLVAVDRTPDAGRPAVMCAAAAHLDPEQACWGALTELVLLVDHLTGRYPEERDRAAAMVADPALVRTMADHTLLHGHQDVVPRWDFLLGAGRDDRERSFAESFARRPEPAGDLRDDLLELVRRYRETGLDVIVVDQTGPEQEAADLASVKVIVPGTLPMTFGHRNRRVHGLPRLGTVPVLLGHRDTPLPEEQVNPCPHPFP